MSLLHARCNPARGSYTTNVQFRLHNELVPVWNGINKYKRSRLLNFLIKHYVVKDIDETLTIFNYAYVRKIVQDELSENNKDLELKLRKIIRSELDAIRQNQEVSRRRKPVDTEHTE